MNAERYKWGGHLAALAVYVIFGINPNCSKAVVPEYISPEVFTAVRMLFGGLVFWLLSLCVKRERVEPQDRKKFFFPLFEFSIAVWKSIQFLFE